MIIRKFIFIILLLTILLLHVNGDEYCSTLVSCKYDVQQQFHSCVKNVLKLFLETNNFPENFIDVIKCKKAAKYFEKLHNNSVLTKHNETLTCANNLILNDHMNNGTKFKCSILTTEIKNKYIFKPVGKPIFEECLNQKIIAEERCDVIEECCMSIGKCNSFYNKSNQERYKKVFNAKSQILKNCFYNHKIALANPENISSSKFNQTIKVVNNPIPKNVTQSNKSVEQVASDKQIDIKKIAAEENITTKKPISKKKKSTKKLKKKGKGKKQSYDKNNQKNKEQKEIFRLNIDVARKVFAAWGCNSVDILKSLLNVSAKKCSKVNNENVKNDNVKMPSIELIEDVLRKDQKILTAHCVRDYKEFGGRCSDETTLAPYDEIGNNIQFCRNYDILDTYKEILDTENDSQECHIRHSKYKLHLYKLKNCCLWSFKKH